MPMGIGCARLQNEETRHEGGGVPCRAMPRGRLGDWLAARDDCKTLRNAATAERTGHGLTIAPATVQRSCGIGVSVEIIADPRGRAGGGGGSDDKERDVARRPNAPDAIIFAGGQQLVSGNGDEALVLWRVKVEGDSSSRISWTGRET